MINLFSGGLILSHLKLLRLIYLQLWSNSDYLRSNEHFKLPIQIFLDALAIFLQTNQVLSIPTPRLLSKNYSKLNLKIEYLSFFEPSICDYKLRST